MQPQACRPASRLRTWAAALSGRWQIYAIEAAGLAGFLLVVGVVDSVLFAAESPLYSLTTSDVLKRVFVGLTAGGYLVALVYSPFGAESGAHINPSITLGFLRLGKIGAMDAGFYIGAHFVGAILGVAIYAEVMGARASDPAVNYIVTAPGTGGLASRVRRGTGNHFRDVLTGPGVDGQSQPPAIYGIAVRCLADAANHGGVADFRHQSEPGA